MGAEVGDGRPWREAPSEAVDGEIVTTQDDDARPGPDVTTTTLWRGSWLVSVLLDCWPFTHQRVVTRDNYRD